MRAAFAAGAVLLLTCASASPSEPWKVVHARAEAGARERVATHGRWEREHGVCKPKELARLELVDAPRHGSVAFEREEGRPRKCKEKLPQAAVYYTGAPAFRGQDGFSYLRIDPESGERRLVVVEVLVEPAEADGPRAPAPSAPEPDPGWSCPAPYPPFEVVFTGDILLGDAGAELFRARGFAHAFAYPHELLAGDFVIGNAEGPITAVTKPQHPEQRWSYAADPRTAATLREAGFTALGIANNHASDRGPEGLRDTLSHLERAGIRSFGAGSDASQALRPLWIETPFGRVAVVGMATRMRYVAEAQSGEPGIAIVTPERIEKAAREAKAAGARWLVAYVHWGRNYRGVTAEQRELAKLFADAGYDLV